MEAPAIEIKSVYKFYADPRGLRGLIRILHSNESLDDLLESKEHFLALSNISLSIAKGERVGIIGRNGAGKSTLLRLMTGNFVPSFGEISSTGEVKALLQSGLGFHPDLTGRENIRTSLQYMMIDPQHQKSIEQEIIEFSELSNFIDKPFRTLSLGMQARLQFATATSIRPETLIIDEFLGAGDLYFASKSAERIHQLATSGCTFVVVSHDTASILRLCDRVIWIDSGKIAMDGSPQEIVNAYEAFTESLREQHKSDRLMHESSVDASEWLLDKIGAHDTSKAHFRFPDGTQGWRWPGTGRVQFRQIAPQLTERETASPPFYDLEVAYLVEVITLKETFRILLSIFGLDGQRKAWVISPPLDRGLGTTTIKCRLAPCLLDQGTYVFSTSIFDAAPLENLTSDLRHDLVSRSVSVTLRRPSGIGPAVIHHPSSWA